MKRYYIGGTFDLLHPGHVALFKRAYMKGGRVIVSVNTDEFAERYKRKPIMTLDERTVMLESCRYVDEVIVNEGCEDSRQAIIEAQATHIVHGSDWTGEGLMEQMGFDQAWLDAHKIEMLYLPYTDGISTGDLIERVSEELMAQGVVIDHA